MFVVDLSMRLRGIITNVPGTVEYDLRYNVGPPSHELVHDPIQLW